ncbi:LemA family protein [Novosphingopyxis iocasae]|uniref:LemA family protein n=1 Tax=Novosphingopyxis iocasae TaxID=2762729 RepID=UPI001650E801|nr:LemA family protein [Novosphingopyxis iocasae]
MRPALPKFLPKLLIAALAASLLSACGINSVPTAEENAKARWADVEAAYQRRADLIPNLANTAERYAEQERNVLTEVTEARARATSVQVNADDLDNPQALQNFAQAQGQLGQSLGRLLASFEAYPDLKSNQNFLALQNELERTENRINIARRDYNEAVREYNTTIRTFPDIIGAKIIHGAEPLVPFEADAGAEKAPEVFGKS